MEKYNYFCRYYEDVDADSRMSAHGRWDFGSEP